MIGWVVVWLFVFACLRRLDENVAGASEEGGYFEQEEQDHGTFADQGKPSIWSYPFVLLFLLSMFYLY